MPSLNSLAANWGLFNSYQNSIGPNNNLSDVGQQQAVNTSFAFQFGSGGGPGLISVTWMLEGTVASGAIASYDLAQLSGQFSNYYQWFSMNKVKSFSVENITNFGTVSGFAQSTQLSVCGSSGSFQGWMSSGSIAYANANGAVGFADPTGYTVASGVNSLVRITNLDLSGNFGSYRITLNGSTTSG